MLALFSLLVHCSLAYVPSVPLKPLLLASLCTPSVTFETMLSLKPSHLDFVLSHSWLSPSSVTSPVQFLAAFVLFQWLVEAGSCFVAQTGLEYLGS